MQETDFEAIRVMGTARVFFVLHLPERCPDRTATRKFEIQLLDRYGRATACGYVSDTETVLTIGQVEVPRAVIDAARRQPLGVGDFVDSNGSQVLPKDLFEYTTEPCECDPGT